MPALSKVHVIAVIEDDKSIRSAVAEFLKSSSFAVEVFAAAEEFVRSKSMGDTACVIIDTHMPGMGGLQLQSHLASHGRHIPIIFITACLDKTARARALEVGAVDFLLKPSGEEPLLKEIRSTLRVRGAEEHASDSKPEDGMWEIFLISVVDDDESVRRATGRLIRSFGLTAIVFASAQEFLLSSHLRDTSCLILDVQMPRMNGLQLQTHLAQTGCRIPIIFITAFPDEKVRARALQAGAVDFLEKPFSDDALLNGIRRALGLGTVDGLPR